MTTIPYPGSINASASRLRIRVGEKRSPTEFRLAYHQSGCRVGAWANTILEQCVFSSEVSELELELVSGASLGITSPVAYHVLCARAAELGLDLCPAEVAPCLVLIQELPVRMLRMAMRPLSDAHGRQLIFAIEESAQLGRWLDAFDGRSEMMCYPGWTFCFVRH